jgi:Xaa-Pro aminopeptidase
MSNSEYLVNIITDTDLIRYFTRFDADDGFLILQGDKKILFVDNRYYFAAKSKADCECELLQENSLANFIKDNDIKTAGIVYEYTTASFYSDLTKLGVEVFDCSEYIFNLTSVKTAREIEIIKQSCAIAEKSFYQLLPSIKEGVSEKDLKALVNFKRLRELVK